MPKENNLKTKQSRVAEQPTAISGRSESRDRLRELIKPVVEMTPAEKLKRAMEISSLGLRMKWQTLRRDLPEATEADVQQLFEDWLYRRDSAPSGDCPGSQRQIQ
jgi:hypothetical protein